MSKPTAIALFVLLIAASSAAAEIRGAWTAEVQDDQKIQLNLTHRGSHNGHTMAASDFAGLTDAALRATTQTPATFELKREAGRIALEGTFKNGFGAGQFTFNENPNYIATLRNLGVTFEESDHDGDEMLTMTMLDVSTDFIRSLQAEGYRGLSGEKYVAMRIFKVTPELIRELRSLGFDKIDADELVATRIHKVTPDYIRSMRAAGYTNLSLDNLVAFRIHKVTPEFIRQLRDLGYQNVPADDLVAMRIHRVTPEFIKELKNAGYERIPIEKLIEMHIHGIDANFVRKMNK